MRDGILICTPMYGGQCTEEYFRSCLALQEILVRENIDYKWYTLSNESLITRARNVCAAVFLKETNFSHLLFIDADIGFTPEHVSRLLNLDMPVSAGCYRMKKEGSKYAVWRDGQLVDLDQFGQPFTADYAGTGFMLIHREALEKLRLENPDWEYEEGQVGKIWAFFQDPIRDGIHLSEDYFFCEEWRRHGELWIDPSVRLDHVGTKVYGPEQHSAQQSAAA